MVRVARGARGRISPWAGMARSRSSARMAAPTCRALSASRHGRSPTFAGVDRPADQRAPGTVLGVGHRRPDARLRRSPPDDGDTLAGRAPRAALRDRENRRFGFVSQASTGIRCWSRFRVSTKPPPVRADAHTHQLSVALTRVCLYFPGIEVQPGSTGADQPGTCSGSGIGWRISSSEMRARSSTTWRISATSSSPSYFRPSMPARSRSSRRSARRAAGNTPRSARSRF